MRAGETWLAIPGMLPAAISTPPRSVQQIEISGDSPPPPPPPSLLLPPLLPFPRLSFPVNPLPALSLPPLLLYQATAPAAAESDPLPPSLPPSLMLQVVVEDNAKCGSRGSSTTTSTARTPSLKVYFGGRGNN